MVLQVNPLTTKTPERSALPIKPPRQVAPTDNNAAAGIIDEYNKAIAYVQNAPLGRATFVPDFAAEGAAPVVVTKTFMDHDGNKVVEETDANKPGWKQTTVLTIHGKLTRTEFAEEEPKDKPEFTRPETDLPYKPFLREVFEPRGGDSLHHETYHIGKLDVGDGWTVVHRDGSTNHSWCRDTIPPSRVLK